MNVKQIIRAYPTEHRYVNERMPQLQVSEFYYNTIQGEGVYTGHPAAFLRLKGCHMNCSYCDTKEVWRCGNPYTIHELIKMIEESGLKDKLEKGQHLVITGGSPMLQQKGIIQLLDHFYNEFGFDPFVELENECTILPETKFVHYIDCWNNSPKLSSSGVPLDKRFNPTALVLIMAQDNSWFKFVVSAESDWKEIEDTFLTPGGLRRDQIILMPEGTTAEEIMNKREMVINMAIRYNVRYCTREHIMVWGKKT